jgi:hypothetical protein
VIEIGQNQLNFDNIKPNKGLKRRQTGVKQCNSVDFGQNLRKTSIFFGDGQRLLKTLKK